MWFPLVDEEWNLVTTTFSVNTSNGYDPPQGAMASVATYVNDNGTWDMPWSLEDSTTRTVSHLPSLCRDSNFVSQ